MDTIESVNMDPSGVAGSSYLRFLETVQNPEAWTWESWYRTPGVDEPSPCARHEAWLAENRTEIRIGDMTAEVAYNEPLAPMLKGMTPKARKAKRLSEVAALKARIAELEAALSRWQAFAEAA